MPVTSKGRVVCVIFALFGAPLAIITIGDLGKFLSECTIWLYKRLKQIRNWLRTRLRKFGTRNGRSNEVVTDVLESGADKQSKTGTDRSTLDWEDLIMDKTQVPVLMVFTILLLYIAFGAVLFTFLEDWTYVSFTRGNQNIKITPSLLPDGLLLLLLHHADDCRLRSTFLCIIFYTRNNERNTIEAHVLSLIS